MSIIRASSLLWFSLTASLCTAGVACGGSTSSSGDGFSAGDSGTDDSDGGTDTDGGGVIPPSTALAAVPLSSCIPSSYTLAATIGTQTFDITIDTGSTTLGVADNACTSCQVSPEYTPGSTATDEGEQAQSQYESGSWTGEIYQDSVTIDKQTSVPVKLVAIQTQSQFFNPQQCNNKSSGIQGIIGLAPAGDELSGTNGYFDRFVATTKAPNIFATMLCDDGGTLWLGGYDSTFTTAAPQYTPMLADFSAETYAVDLVSVTVNAAAGATTAKIGTASFPDSIVDTGTSIFIVPTAAYNSITKAIGADPSFSKLFGAASYFSSPENCKSVSQTKAELDSTLPSLTLTIGTASPIQVQATATESYLSNYENMWCPSLLAQDPSDDFPASSIMGAPILRSNVVIFDRVNKQVGFAPHTTCPTK